MDTSQQSLSVGYILQNGKYKIVRFINSGGFGCTYEAIHTVFETRVAIKEFFVKDFCNRDETSHVSVGTNSKVSQFNKLKKKFVDEAKALHGMHHQGIVHVSDIFEENGTAYYVMDYIDGKSLQEIVKQDGALSESDAVKYILQVADALKYVHSKNRLHLDIKPGNIMIDSEGNAILIDFGASKHYDEETGENTSTLLGINTKGYAPIEQMHQSFNTFNAATDIYSLGATLYKLLTGTTPPDAVLIASGEIDKPELSPKFSDNVRNVINQSMMLKRADRPQSVAKFIDLLSSKDNSTDCEIITLDEETEYNGIKDKISINNNIDKTKSQVIVGSNRGKVISVVSGIIGIVAVTFVSFLIFFNKDKTDQSSNPTGKIEYYHDLSNINIGDYLYSDGSYTNVLDSANLANCSGCVYNLFTTTDEQKDGWTHGHIVALRDAINRDGDSEFIWGPENKAMPNTDTYSKASQFKDGYWYCLLDSTCQSPAISSLEDFDGLVFDVPLIKGSKWYVPTVSDWNDILLHLGNAKLNEENSSLVSYDNSSVAPILQKKIGAFPKRMGKQLGYHDYSYWTCIQQGENWTPDGILPRAWAIYGHNEFGCLGNSPTRNKMRVRPVSAF